MTADQIDSILERVRSWPKARQEDAARLLLTLEEQDTDIFILSAQDEADIEAALEDVAKGNLATEEEVQELFSRYRR